MKRFILGVAAVALLLAGPAWAQAAGGKVLPATATPSGYSLEDMALELAYFDTSGNDLDYYPDTPFQILYASETNTFTVRTGTRFFVPIFTLDDSYPIIGDFPANADDAAEYVFGATQVGASDVEIQVDDVVTEIGREYVAGPVYAPGLLDPNGHPPGSHFIQVGAFLTPLSKGTHTVTVRYTLDGEALVELYGYVDVEFSYTVIVK